MRHGRSPFASSRGVTGTPTRVRTGSGNRCGPRCAGPVPGHSVEAFTGLHRSAAITRSYLLRSGELTASGLGGALAVCAALLAACGASDEESRAKDGGGAKPVSQVLKLSVETAPGVVRFDKERLSAKARSDRLRADERQPEGTQHPHPHRRYVLLPARVEGHRGHANDRHRTHACSPRPEAGHLHIPVLHRRLLAHAARDAGGAMTRVRRVVELDVLDPLAAPCAVAGRPGGAQAGSVEDRRPGRGWIRLGAELSSRARRP
jgi:hypothetical protein